MEKYIGRLFSDLDHQGNPLGAPSVKVVINLIF